MLYTIFAMRVDLFDFYADEIVLEGDFDKIVIDKRDIKTIGYSDKDMVFAIPNQLFNDHRYNPIYYSGYIGMFKA